MSPLNVTLPDALRRFVEQQAMAGGFASSEQYICELVKRAHEIGQPGGRKTAVIADRRQLEMRLLQGVESLDAGRVIEGNDDYRKSLEARAADWKGRTR